MTIKRRDLFIGTGTLAATRVAHAPLHGGR